MITTGIIKEINIDSKNIIGNKYLVEIPLFKKPGYSSPETYIMKANACCFNGSYGEFEPGDFVYISFIDGELSFPVILGKIYKGDEKKFRGDLKINNLEVSNSVIFPENFKIGNLDWSDIKKIITKMNSDKNKIFNHHIGIELLSGNICYINIYLRDKNSYTTYANEDSFQSLKLLINKLNNNDPQNCIIKKGSSWINGLIFSNKSSMYCSYSGSSGNDEAIKIISDDVFIID